MSALYGWLWAHCTHPYLLGMTKQIIIPEIQRRLKKTSPGLRHLINVSCSNSLAWRKGGEIATRKQIPWQQRNYEVKANVQLSLPVPARLWYREEGSTAIPFFARNCRNFSQSFRNGKIIR